MKKAKELIESFLKKQEYDELNKYASFFSGWERVAGVDIAAHSRIADIKRNALVVDVEHPGWMQMLQIKQGTILKKIQKEYPQLKIKSIKARLKDMGQKSEIQQEQRDIIEVDDESALKDVNMDDNLRILLAKLERTLKQKNKGRQV